METNYLDSKIVFNKIKSFIYKINIFNNWTKIEIVLDNIQDTNNIVFKVNDVPVNYINNNSDIYTSVISNLVFTISSNSTFSIGVPLDSLYTSSSNLKYTFLLDDFKIFTYLNNDSVNPNTLFERDYLINNWNFDNYNTSTDLYDSLNNSDNSYNITNLNIDNKIHINKGQLSDTNNLQQYYYDLKIHDLQVDNRLSNNTDHILVIPNIKLLDSNILYLNPFTISTLFILNYSEISQITNKKFIIYSN